MQLKNKLFSFVNISQKRFYKHLSLSLFILFLETFAISQYCLRLNSENKIFWLLSVLCIVLGIITCWLYSDHINHKTPKNINISNKTEHGIKIGSQNKRIKLLIVVFLFVIAFCFSLVDLGKFITRDEPRWINYFQQGMKSPQDITQSNDIQFGNEFYGRSVSYWNSYFSGNPKGTLGINAGSGVITSILELPSYFFQNSSKELYLFISRITFILTNFILVLICFFLLRKLITHLQSILFLSLILLNPIFLGFSRIVNHDSITGTLVATFLLLTLIGIKYNNKRYFIYAGVLYTLSSLTSGKAAFIVPLLWLCPLIVTMISKENISTFIERLRKNLFYFFVAAILSFVLILPATIYYPELILTKLIIPGGFLAFPAILLLLISINKPAYKYIGSAIIGFCQKWESFIVRLFVLILTSSLVYTFINLNHIILNGNLTENSMSFLAALSGTLVYFFYALPLVVLFFLLIWSIYYFYKPRFDLSFIFMILFFGLLILSIFPTYSLSIFASTGIHASGFLAIYKKYQMILLPLFMIAISAARFWQEIKYKWLIPIIVGCILALFLVSLNISPNYILYSNKLFPSKQILYPYSWGIGIYQAAEYLNQITAQQSNVMVFDPYGTGDKFFNSNIFPVDSADQAEYIIVNKYTPNSINEETSPEIQTEKLAPIWSYKINGFNAVSIYKIVTFDDNIK